MSGIVGGIGNNDDKSETYPAFIEPWVNWIKNMGMSSMQMDRKEFYWTSRNSSLCTWFFRHPEGQPI